MKTFLISAALLSAQILSCPLYAEEAPAALNSALAKEAFQSLSPEQKAQAKEQGKAMAQEKAQAFQQLSPEQRQQKRTEFVTQFRTRRAAH